MTKSGFTLVEVLMAALIATLIGGALLVVAIAGHRVSDLTNARLTAMTSAQQAMNRLAEDLRMASRSTKSSDVITCEAADGPNPPKLQFKRVMPDGSLSPQIRYFLKSTGQLIRQLRPWNASTERVVASGVTAFDYSSVCDGAAASLGIAQIRLTAQANSLRGQMTQTVESQVWLRNPKP